MRLALRLALSAINFKVPTGAAFTIQRGISFSRIGWQRERATRGTVELPALRCIIIAGAVKSDSSRFVAPGKPISSGQIGNGVAQIHFGIEKTFRISVVTHASRGLKGNLHQPVVAAMEGSRLIVAFLADDEPDERLWDAIDPCVARDQIINRQRARRRSSKCGARQRRQGQSARASRMQMSAPNVSWATAAAAAHQEAADNRDLNLKVPNTGREPWGECRKGPMDWRRSQLSEEPEDQDDNKDKSQNAARTTRPKAAVAVSAAAQENEKQNNNENCNHGLPPDAPNAHLNVAPSLF